jgi:pyruvate dehydrogenase E1 component alpha subunit
MSEAMNLAAIESASVLFVCQNNGWAISKPAGEQMRSSVADRARGFGIDSVRVPGQDPEIVFAACSRAAAHVRGERAPCLVEIQVARIHGHTTSDAQEVYRTRDDIARAKAADPVTAYAARLRDLGLVDTAWFDAVGAEVRELRERLVKEYA